MLARVLDHEQDSVMYQRMIRESPKYVQARLDRMILWARTEEKLDRRYLTQLRQLQRKASRAKSTEEFDAIIADDMMQVDESIQVAKRYADQGASQDTVARKAARVGEAINMEE